MRNSLRMEVYLEEGVDHAEDHPDVDHLGIGGRWQGAGQTDKAERYFYFFEEMQLLTKWLERGAQ